MVTFIIRFVWFCNVIEHLNGIFFQGSLWLYILEVKSYRLEKLLALQRLYRSCCKMNGLK